MSERKNIDFVGKIRLALLCSVATIVLGFIFILFQGGLNYNIEFNGGYLMHAGFYEKVNIADIRSAFSSTNLSSIEIQEFSDSNTGTDDFGTELVLKLETMDKDVKEIEKEVTTILNNKFGTDAYEVRQASSIGPKVGNELKGSTLKAIFWSLLFILIYITIKFKFRYGIAAIVALFHDVLITIGILSILGYFFDLEISLSVIAGILTLVGYSLNDTI
ncbi:MAG: hypothetical protein L6407_03070, partial [Candidatus Delongbacteria bacterium]|nr:hypothetical protein [Candidatus Delongbacteria bacterium]